MTEPGERPADRPPEPEPTVFLAEWPPATSPTATTSTATTDAALPDLPQLPAATSSATATHTGPIVVKFRPRYRLRLVTVLQLAGAALLLLCAGCGVLVFRGFVGDLAADLGTIVTAVAALVLLLGGHVLVVWWLTTHPRPGRAGLVQWAIVQVPFLVTYVMTYVWFFHPFPYGKAPSLGYLPWAFFGLGAVAAAVVGWLHVPRELPYRRLVGLVVLGVLVVGNGVPALVIGWNATYGFGLSGEDSPGAAVTAATSLSCLKGSLGATFYHRRGTMTEADCPNGPEHYRARYALDGGHDPDLDLLLSSDQPREAFARWWAHQHEYDSYTSLEFWDDAAVITGDTAELRSRVVLRLAPGVMTGARWFGVDKTDEVWVFHLDKAPLGGWQINRIDVLDPIVVTDRGIYSGA